MRRTVYQFEDPRAAGDTTRWIAAKEAAQAQAYAQQQGWREIPGCLVLFPETSALREQFETMGCDVILSEEPACEQK